MAKTNFLKGLSVTKMTNLFIENTDFIILAVDDRYIHSGDIRNLVSLTRIDIDVWKNSRVLVKWAASHGYGMDEEDYNGPSISAALIPKWAMDKFGLFKPTSPKNVKRALSYMISRGIFHNYCSIDSVIEDVANFGDRLMDDNDEKAKRCYARLVYLINYLLKKEDTGIISSTDMEMVAQFITAICENTDPKKISHAVNVCARKKNADIQRLYRKCKTKKGTELPDSFHDLILPDNEDLRVDDDEDDEPEVEAAPPKPAKAPVEPPKATPKVAPKATNPTKQTETDPKNLSKRDRKKLRNQERLNEIQKVNAGKPTQVVLKD